MTKALTMLNQPVNTLYYFFFCPTDDEQCKNELIYTGSMQKSLLSFRLPVTRPNFSTNMKKLASYRQSRSNSR
jgi:hypothetical protein